MMMSAIYLAVHGANKQTKHARMRDGMQERTKIKRENVWVMRRACLFVYGRVCARQELQQR